MAGSGFERSVTRRARVIAGKALLFASLTIATVSLVSSASLAATGNVTFEGTIDTNASFSVTVRQDGGFGISADYRLLSSKIAGGQGGIADVLAIGNYSVSAPTFSSFTAAPSGGGTSTTTQSVFSGSSLLLGANFAERPGNNSPVVLPAGLSYTRINTHLVATRTGNAFPTGYYQGIVIVRYE